MPSAVSETPLCEREELDFIVNNLAKYCRDGTLYILPSSKFSCDIEVPLSTQQVTSAWSGFRPLVQSPKAAGETGRTEKLVRNHLIDVSPQGMVTISGGKWTTYRHMAEETVDTCIQHAGTPPCHLNTTNHHAFMVTPMPDNHALYRSFASIVTSQRYRDASLDRHPRLYP